MLPAANYVFATSRLHPGRDGGYTVASLRRTRQFLDYGGAASVILTFDLAPSYEVHRSGFRELGLTAEGQIMRNLFEDTLTEPEWLWAAANPNLTTMGDVAYDDHADAEGRVLLSTPNAPRADWHRTTEPLLAYRNGRVVGGFEGFGGFYRAWVSRIIAGFDNSLPTVIIAESRQVGELLWPLRGKQVRLVHTVHSAHTQPPHGWDSPVDELWGGWLDGLANYDAVVFPTVAQRDDVARRFGEPTRLEVIPHALEAPADGDASGDAVEFDPSLVAMITRLVPLKRVDHVIRAIAALRARGASTRLEVFGDGPSRTDLEALITELGVADSVTLLGHVADPGIRVGRAAVSVLSSTYEGQPLAVLESLMRGTPVVAYDINYGPRDMVEHGVNGLLVPPGDVEALTDAIGQILDDDALRARLAAGARATVDRLGPVPVMRRWAALLTDVLAG